MIVVAPPFPDTRTRSPAADPSLNTCEGRPAGFGESGVQPGDDCDVICRHVIIATRGDCYQYLNTL
jgi:hypothetical protein